MDSVVAPAAAANPAVRPPGPLATTRARVTGLVLGVGLTAYVGLVNPATDGLYPPCPSRVLLGLDCPACGGLRGTHDLLHGDVAGALDHNLLLPGLVAVLAVLAGLWLWPLTGRAAPVVRWPRWLVVTGAAVAMGFMVVRNLPVDSLAWLGSGA